MRSGHSLLGLHRAPQGPWAPPASAGRWTPRCRPPGQPSVCGSWAEGSDLLTAASVSRPRGSPEFPQPRQPCRMESSLPAMGPHQIRGCPGFGGSQASVTGWGPGVPFPSALEEKPQDPSIPPTRTNGDHPDFRGPVESLPHGYTAGSPHGSCIPVQVRPGAFCGVLSPAPDLRHPLPRRAHPPPPLALCLCPLPGPLPGPLPSALPFPTCLNPYPRASQALPVPSAGLSAP